MPPEAPPPFSFPLRAPSWPVRDRDAGIAFPKGGMHGAFHTGVVHAFVMSGFFPAQAGGSSMGAYAATTLAIAADLERQPDRLRLVEELMDVWVSHPGRLYYTNAWNQSNLRELLEETGTIDVPLERIGRLCWDVFQGTLWKRILGVLSLWWIGFAPTSRGRKARIHMALSALRGGIDWLRGRNVSAAVPVAQALLNVYGMRESLLRINPGEAGFNDLFERWLPRFPHRGRTLEDFKHTRLTLQLTNLRVAQEAAVDRSRERNPVVVIRDGQEADLLATLKAVTALQPMHAPQLAKDVFPRGLPAGFKPEDALVDSFYIAAIPIGRLIDRWREEPAEDRQRPKRLFTVYSDPIDGAPPTGEGYFTHAIHDLYLLAQRDHLFDVHAARLVTELLRAGAPMEDHPAQAVHTGGGSAETRVLVDPEIIAPSTILGFQQVSVPDDAILLDSIPHGCRTALEVLHAETLATLGDPGGTVACDTLLAALRARSTAPEGYFVPSNRVCAKCTKLLRVAPQAPPPPPPELREADRVSRLAKGPPPADAPPLVLVPAGGAFLGVFQVGAMLALREHGLAPDVYAGASVGTMFSTILHKGLERGKGVDPRLIERMLDVDKWVDRDDKAVRPDGTAGPGRVDALLTRLQDRLARPDVKAMLALSPGRLVRILRGDPTGPELRDQVNRGLSQLLFWEAVGPRGTRVPALTPEEAGRETGEVLEHVLSGNLAGMLRFADLVARHLGVYEPGFEHEGEVVGFDETERLLRVLAFDGKEPPTLAEHGGERAHFLFPVTNHTTGRAELFGGPSGDTSTFSVPDSPNALQAVLAGSSIPIAFRRRSHTEVFGKPRPDGKEVYYVDGGVYNNFPVDSALSYLRHLSRFPEYAWLGHREVRFVLLPLKFPTPPERRRAEPGCLRSAMVSWNQAEHQKLQRILQQQAIIRRLARDANAVHGPPEPGTVGPPMAILADFDLVAPARQVYLGAFSFKRWLGFTPESQVQLLAAGCRRARYSLLYRAWREAKEARKEPARLERFDAEIRKEIHASPRGASESGCVLGRFNPRPCAFMEVDPTTGARIRASCRSTACKDLRPDELPVTSRVDMWARRVRPKRLE